MNTNKKEITNSLRSNLSSFNLKFEEDWYIREGYIKKGYTLFYLTVQPVDFLQLLKKGDVINTENHKLIILRCYGNQWWRRVLKKLNIKVRINQIKCFVKN